MVRRARCCCGRTTIAVDGEPRIHGICHCDDCKKRTGSAFGWSAYFLDSQILETSGETSAYRVDGTNPQERFFCQVCGSTLFWKSAAFDKMTGVAGGCFVEPMLPEPGLTLSNESRCAWVSLPDHWQSNL